MSRTLVLLKPDTVRRGLIGRIISRFEDADLRISSMKVYDPPERCHIMKHYESTDEWLYTVGDKTIESYKRTGLGLEEVQRDYGETEETAIGRVVKNRLITYLTSGTVIALIIEGNLAVEKVRRLIGATFPAQANPGTIRGDFGSESAFFAASQGRSIENLVHASDSEETAENEIELWFGRGC